MKKRIISWLLCLTIITGIVPVQLVTALAAEAAEAVTIQDKYISVSVSRKNGGFTVKTVEGDRLKKSDNNKKLLYHDGQYDTSFLSLRIGEGGNAKDYIFGGSYDNADKSVEVKASAAGDSITAVWRVDNLTVTQTTALTNTESNESGMVSISVGVKNESGAAVPVQARLLLDTCLGNQDYGYYRYVNNDNTAVVIQQERIIEGDAVPRQLYAVDDVYSSAVTAYTIHTGEMPVKAAFGHWNHLAATLFDFTPSTNLDFTNTRNEYLSADGAYALYYDLGSVAAGAGSEFSTFYGVYSNYATPAENSAAVNITAPIRLELNDAKTDFVPKVNKGSADFAIDVDFTNITSGEEERTYDSIVLAVQSGRNLRSLDDDGNTALGQDYTSTEPYTFPYADFKPGDKLSKALYFEAKPDNEAHYERITIGIYDVSQTGGKVSETYKLGERMAYILLPGSGGDVPKVNFAAMTPKIIYSEGTRHLFVTVANETMLENKANWTLKAYNENDKKKAIEIPPSNISIKDGVMDVALTEEEKLAAGAWYLQLEWADNVVGEGADKLVPKSLATQSGSELHFTVSNDKKYKNDSYGVLAVIEYDGYSGSADSKKFYKIRTFTDEEDFASYKEKPKPHHSNYGEYSEIIFVFKGEFTAAKKVDDLGTYYTAVSTKEEKDGKTVIDNPIVINDCLDFEDGTLSVYYEDYESTNAASSAVCTEFKGKLYTNKARTSVWTGRAVFTKLKQNYGNYSLAPYSEDGERGYIVPKGEDRYLEEESEDNKTKRFTDIPIYLMWPSAAQLAQTLSGLLVKLTYGQFGIMYDTDGYGKIEEELGTVISFAAALDLTFASGDVAGNGNAPDTYWSKIKDIWELYRDEESPYNYTDALEDAMDKNYWSSVDEEKDDPTKATAKASVMVRDILFGCGKGFVGVNFSVGVAIKNYVTALPEIEGTISVNTVNNWQYGVEGKLDMDVFTVEAEVSFKSRNNIPVPDNFYVFVSGVEPGINIDGMGVCWITGGGGGISNLYDSIFSTKKLPPLKLLLSVSFEILKVLECEKATVSLGPTGIGVSAEKIGVKAVPGLTAVERMGLSLEWYPGITLQANIVVNLFQGLISGGGYIVLLSPDYKDVFFEMFARASLNVPKSIPIVGGMRIGGVDLGINSEKIWGAVDVLFITLGLTYYWGESGVDFSNGTKTQPTFPELLGYKDVAVGYDGETNRTLYARIGTNTQLMASSLPDDGSVKLMASSTAELKCLEAVKKNSYRFNLGEHTGTDAMVQIVYAADSYEDAQTKAKTIKVGTAEGSNDYGIVLYDADKNNVTTANANATYDEATGKATYVLTVTDKDNYNKDWYASVPEGSEMLLYNVAAIPEVKKLSGKINGDKLELEWEGSELSELDQISFYLCESNTVDEAYKTAETYEEENTSETAASGQRIGVIEDSTKLASGKATLTIPGDVPSGDYYIRAVYSKSNEVNGEVFSEDKVSFTNSSTPGAVTVKAEPSGDLQYKVTLNNGASTDGYYVTIYEADGKTETDYKQVSFDKTENAETVISVGGSYTAADPNTKETKTFGLTGGKSYIIGVTPYKEITSGTSGKSAVRGKEVRTAAIELPIPKTPTVEFSAAETAKTRTVTEKQLDAEGTVVDCDVEKTVYTASEINLTAKFDEKVSGVWKLDDGAETSFTDTDTVSISLSDLADAEHTVTVRGTAADGDGFNETYVFTVDTLPPQLLLSSPVNGSFFGKDGTITLTGITDPDARFTVLSDGAVICSEKPLDELLNTQGSSYNKKSGEFELVLEIPDPDAMSQRTLSIAVSDDMGNATEPKLVTVSHGGLADLAELEIMVNDKMYANGNLPVPSSGIQNAELALVGVMSNDSRLKLTGYNVSWDVFAAEGTASESDGLLNAEASSQGMVTGRLAVADNTFRSASLSFGTPAGHTVAVSTTIGGTVIGGGDYEPGDEVTLTAVPDSGYSFGGWVITGISGVDTSSAEIKFIMPDNGNVSVDASFTANTPSTAPGGSIGSGSGTAKAESGYYVKGGEAASVALPSGKNEKNYLPYYYDADKNKVFVPITAVVDGNVKFIAPVSAEYYFGENPIEFTDIKGRWSEESILFAAQRSIFNGVGNGLFNPCGDMERAMVITVLYRLAGSPSVDESAAAYSDVEPGSWYSAAVAWGTANGIVNGYGDGVFGVSDRITREQLCTMLARFAGYMGYELPAVGDSAVFNDAETISPWAAEAVEYCRSCGLVNGMEDGAFAPAQSTTREQCCAVIERMIRALLASK